MTMIGGPQEKAEIADRARIRRWSFGLALSLALVLPRDAAAGGLQPDNIARPSCDAIGPTFYVNDAAAEPLATCTYNRSRIAYAAKTVGSGLKSFRVAVPANQTAIYYLAPGGAGNPFTTPLGPSNS
jgi:hypothetical protein